MSRIIVTDSVAAEGHTKIYYFRNRSAKLPRSRPGSFPVQHTHQKYLCLGPRQRRRRNAFLIDHQIPDFGPEQNEEVEKPVQVKIHSTSG